MCFMVINNAMAYLEVCHRKSQKQNGKMLKPVEQINLQNIEHYEYIFSG